MAKSLNIVSPDHSRGEDGFSLVEALVVLAVSSVLLLVLTSTMSLAREQNLRLADHSRLAGNQLYADLQLQALLDNLYIDPLLQPSGAQPSRIDRRSGIHTEASWSALNAGVAFKGTSENFEFSTQYHVAGSEPLPAKVRWIDTREGRQLSLTLDDRTIVWPVIYDSQARFGYLTREGEFLETFPPPLVRSGFGQAPTQNRRQSPILVPKAIIAYRADTQKAVFIVDVP